MTSNVTDFGESQFAGMLFGQTYTVPATYWMGLLTQPPVITDDGTTVQEPIGAGYTRVQFNNNSTFWSAPSGGVVTNIAAITFPLATADWPTVYSYGLFTAVTAGSLYLYGSLQLPRQVLNGHLCKFDIGLLTVSAQGIRQPILSHA